MNQNKASLESQLSGAVCEVKDTEEISALRQSEDYESLKKLGSLLVSQYRYKDALEAFLKAKSIRGDEVFLYFLLGGTYLTLLEFDEAQKMYNIALEKGATQKQTSFYFAFLAFCKGEFEKASDYLSMSLPCDDETKISNIYWDLIASQRLKKESQLKKYFDECQNIGHHKSYKKAVSVMLGLKAADEVLCELEKEGSDLDFVITAFGIAEYFLFIGEKDKSEALTKRLLEKRSVWPCAAYLASYVLNEKK